MIDLSAENTCSSKVLKRKEVPTTDSNNQKKTRKNQAEQENDSAVISDENDPKHQLVLIEIEERRMALQERSTANRKVLAEVEKMELENKIIRKQLESKD